MLPRRALTLAALLASAIVPRDARPQAARAVDDSLLARIDAWMRDGLRRYQIAGGAVAIVERGAITHQRGFGQADVARRTPVDPDRTVFHIASVTKLITAITALQQVDAGRLVLDVDIRRSIGPVGASGWNRYPVTLHELLTHTAGLDIRWTGTAATRPEDVEPLGAFLLRTMPPIIDEPGRRVRYSNYGYAAVGRLVEVVSGSPWSDIVEQRVLRPLGMAHSYVRPRQPDSDHAVPYRYRRDTTPEPAIYEHLAPSGAVHATVADLARLEIAILDSTRASTFLSLESRRLLFYPRATVAPGVRGFAYGTFEFPNDRMYAASAGGEVPGFSTRLLMVPSLAFGVVIAVNRKDPTLAVSVFDSLLQRLPGRRDESSPRGESNSQTASTSIGGQYRPIAYDHGSFLRLGAVLGPTLRVRDDTGRTLIVRDPIRSQLARWTPAGLNAWNGPDGRCLGLLRDGGGTVLTIASASAGPIMFEPVGALANPALALCAAGLALVCLAGVLVVNVSTGTRTLGGAIPAGQRLGRATTLLAAGQIAFVAGFAVGLYRLAIAYDDRFGFGLPSWFRIVLVSPYLLLALTAASGYLLFAEWRRGRSLPRAPALAVAASVTLLAIAWSWSIPAA